MNSDESHMDERQNLQTRLLDAVKQCQVRFGGRTELATETDARVCCLCSAWESVLQHGLKGDTKAIAALKQVSEMTGLTKVAGIFSEKPLEKDMTFWLYVKEILTKHEVDRFLMLKNIDTDSGRGRAWLRAALNEHSLERYMHMLIENETLLSQYYESWSFLCDQEKNSMLPMMARGLGSIVFAITVDNCELNTVRSTGSTGTIVSGSLAPSKWDGELRPVIAGDNVQPTDKEKRKEKKKKKVVHIVSFDEDETGSGKFSRVNNSSRGGSFNNDTSSESTSLPNLLNTKPITNITTDQSTSAIKNTDFKTIDQSESMLHKTMEDIEHSAIKGEHRLGFSGAKRELSANSMVPDSRQSHGSISSTDFDLSMEMNGAVMTPITPSGESALDDDNNSYSRSYDSTSLSAFNGDDDIQSATFALKQAQISFSESHREQGDGVSSTEDMYADRMSSDELKKAVVSMMLRKDEIEDQNRSLQQMLDSEMETCSVLRAEIEDIKQQSILVKEKETAKLNSLQKENELLKHQLRKYVNAVQMLRTEGANVDVNLGIRVDEPQPSIPPEKPATDYSHEAEEYEKKLMQVAEMHGELMEFNEMLQRQLKVRENMLKRLQNELIDLRGPLPQDINFTDDILALGAEHLSLQQTRLINVWIPSAFLCGKSSDSHHAYQVYVRIRDEEWNVYKRYKQFNELYTAMKKKYPLTGKYDFPPKKSFGKKDSKVVESRRHVLQTYLRCLINHILEKDQTLSNNVCKDSLIQILPFFSDKVAEKKKGKKKSDGQRTPLSSSPSQGTPVPEQYGGL